MLILAEMFLASLNSIYSLTLKYPLYFGATDTMPHLYISDITLLSGKIIPKDVDISYAVYPLYHIFVSICTMISGLPLQSAYFLFIPIPFLILIFFLYQISLYLTENIQISLIACLLYSVSSTIVFYGSYVVTRVFAYIGFVIILFLFFKMKRDPSSKTAPTF